MVYIAPIFLALLLNCRGIYIFSLPINYENLPYMTYVIFLISMSFLLCNINLKPTGYQKLFRWADFVIEFVIAMLAMEIATTNFWFPLETVVVSTITKIPEFVSDTMKQLGLKKCKALCDFLELLKLEETLVFVSYLLSIFFFLSITHATQILDFSILIKDGIIKFFEHTSIQGQKLVKEIIAMIKCSSSSSKESSSYVNIADVAYIGSSNGKCDSCSYLN